MKEQLKNWARTVRKSYITSKARKNMPAHLRMDVTAVSIEKGHHNVTYRGVKAIRCPFDYVIYQMILSEVKPDLVIEIGTNIGGGALYIADLLERLGDGVMHSIDIKDQADSLVKNHPRIKLFTNGWEEYDLALTANYSNILVIEDGSHEYSSSLAALHKFSPLVGMGSYYIVEDGIIDELGMSNSYNGGPLKATLEFLATNRDFEIDAKWCNFFGKNATFNTQGYLKRVR